MRDRVNRLNISLVLGWNGFLWVLPRHRQKQMNQFAQAAERNRARVFKRLEYSKRGDSDKTRASAQFNVGSATNELLDTMSHQTFMQDPEGWLH